MRVTIRGAQAILNSLVAQQAPPPLSEQMDVTLVNVHVTVLDAAGKPVAGLTQEDFEVFEDSVRQQITNFSAVVEAAQPASTAAQADPERQQHVAVLIDERALLDAPLRARAIVEIWRLIEASSDDAQWSVLTIRGTMRNELPFTSDKEAIRRALDAVRRGVPLPKRGTIPAAGPLGNPLAIAMTDCPNGKCVAKAFSDIVEAAEPFESDASFFGAVMGTARALAWMPGTKAILLVSSDVPGYLSPKARTAAVQSAQAHQEMVREANLANAAIWILDPMGVGGDFQHAQRSTSAAVWLARLTGGLYLPNNRIDESLQKFEAATANYYEIGYHASSPAGGKYHHLQVRLKRPGSYTITHRDGYFRVSKEAAFQRAQLTPLGISSQEATLPISVSISDPQQTRAGELTVQIRTSVPLERITFLRRNGGRTGRVHVYISVFSVRGERVEFRHFVETITDPPTPFIVVSKEVSLKSGTYTMFVTVRDELSDDVGLAAKEIRL